MNGDLKCLACPGPFCHGDTQHAPLCCGVGKHCVHGAGGVYECDVGTRVPACMESVHELRGTTHADAVMMLTSSTTQCPAFSPPLGCISNAAFCGLSYLTVNRSSPNSSMLISPESAYGLVNVGGYAPFAFAHELGHILGSQHDIGSYAGTNYTLPAYSYSYGYYWVLDPNNFPGVDSFQTIMGAQNATIIPRIPLFSDPDLQHDGVNVGAESADNVRSINNTAPLVARFRLSEGGGDP